MALNQRQQLFVKEYLVDFNATQAAIRAGYSPKAATPVASRLLTNANIKKAIAEATKERTEAIDLTVEDVLRDMLDTRDTCARAMAYTDDDGVEHIDASAANARVKCNEQLGKYLAMFKDKVEMEISKMPDIRLTK